MVNKNELRDYAKYKKLTTDLIFEVITDITDMSKPWSYSTTYLESSLFSRSFKDIIKSNNIEDISDLKNQIEVYISYLKLNNIISNFSKEVWNNGLSSQLQSNMSGELSTPFTNYPSIIYSIEKDYYNNVIFCIQTNNLKDHISLSVNLNNSENRLILYKISATEEVATALIHCFTQVYKNNKKLILK